MSSTAASPIVLLPDSERLVSRYLRGHPAIAELVDERVYTAMPAHRTGETFVLVQRVGGIPPFPRPLVLDQAQLQIDAWGGSKRDAWTIAETIRQALQALPGVHADGVVTAVDYGLLQWQPDGTFTPPRPRYLFDAFVYCKPPAAALASATADTARARAEEVLPA
jgi:hypothetical protein